MFNALERFVHNTVSLILKTEAPQSKQIAIKRKEMSTNETLSQKTLKRQTLGQ